jgi:hypothetical protein
MTQEICGRLHVASLRAWRLDDKSFDDTHSVDTHSLINKSFDASKLSDTELTDGRATRVIKSGSLENRSMSQKKPKVSAHVR